MPRSLTNHGMSPAMSTKDTHVAPLGAAVVSTTVWSTTSALTMSAPSDSANQASAPACRIRPPPVSPKSISSSVGDSHRAR